VEVRFAVDKLLNDLNAAGHIKENTQQVSQVASVVENMHPCTLMQGMKTNFKVTPLARHR